MYTTNCEKKAWNVLFTNHEYHWVLGCTVHLGRQWVKQWQFNTINYWFGVNCFLVFNLSTFCFKQFKTGIHKLTKTFCTLTSRWNKFSACRYCKALATSRAISSLFLREEMAGRPSWRSHLIRSNTSDTESPRVGLVSTMLHNMGRMFGCCRDLQIKCKN